MRPVHRFTLEDSLPLASSNTPDGWRPVLARGPVQSNHDAFTPHSITNTDGMSKQEAETGKKQSRKQGKKAVLRFGKHELGLGWGPKHTRYYLFPELNSRSIDQQPKLG